MVHMALPRLVRIYVYGFGWDELTVRYGSELNLAWERFVSTMRLAS